jgi:hypothetical protein
MSEENAVVAVKSRTASVTYKDFALVYKRVASAGGNVADVIQGVFDATGVKMTEQNVNVKASALRKAGADIGKLTRKGRNKRDIAALNAVLEAEQTADVANETAETETAPTAEVPAAS